MNQKYDMAMINKVVSKNNTHLWHVEGKLISLDNELLIGSCITTMGAKKTNTVDSNIIAMITSSRTIHYFKGIQFRPDNTIIYRGQEIDGQGKEFQGTFAYSENPVTIITPSLNEYISKLIQKNIYSETDIGLLKGMLNDIIIGPEGYSGGTRIGLK